MLLVEAARKRLQSADNGRRALRQSLGSGVKPSCTVRGVFSRHMVVHGAEDARMPCAARRTAWQAMTRVRAVGFATLALPYTSTPHHLRRAVVAAQVAAGVAETAASERTARREVSIETVETTSCSIPVRGRIVDT